MSLLVIYLIRFFLKHFGIAIIYVIINWIMHKTFQSKLDQIENSDIYPFHMPGHKRQSIGTPICDVYKRDITEIDGYDNLHDPKEFILEEEQFGAKLFGSEECFYLVNGSSCGILASIMSVADRPGKYLVARNCHKSVFHALYLSGKDAQYVYPEGCEDIPFNGNISVAQIEQKLSQDDYCAVIITSPTYEGIVSDVRTICEAAHKKFLNDCLSGKIYGCDGRGELYNDDPKLKDARLCGTTASLCGIEASEYELNQEKLEKAINLDIMLHAFLLTQSGIPVLYSGDEVGQLNDYTYHEDEKKADDSRYLHRGNLDWKSVAKRKKKGTRENRIFTKLHELIGLRTRHRVFESNADTWIVETWNNHILGIGRYYRGEKLIALFNFNDSPETAWIDEKEDYTDLLSGEKIKARAVTLPGNGFKWMLTTF